MGEIYIRVFRLVPDIPERKIDKYGIQRYKPFQTGYYTKAKTKWGVNEFGWLGTCEIKTNKTVSIIGDSYIENIMNPIECNQGNILKSHFSDLAFFEAGRSGVTFIEAMEISKALQEEIDPKLQLLYLSSNDFIESIADLKRFKDRLQLSIENGEILRAKIRLPVLKKILYNVKILYFIYTKYPVFSMSITWVRLKKSRSHLCQLMNLNWMVYSLTLLIITI